MQFCNPFPLYSPEKVKNVTRFSIKGTMLNEPVFAILNITKNSRMKSRMKYDHSYQNPVLYTETVSFRYRMDRNDDAVKI